MFQRPFRVKSNTQLKGSERKKIRSEIQKNFPQLTDDDLQQVLPQKDPVSVVKIWTHSHEQVMVYCTPNIPLIFEVEKIMYPTIYLLWKFPGLLYTFTTWAPVISKLTSGADLMLPGVIVKEPFNIKSFGKLEKGELVAVNISTNRAPLAVGKTALSSIDMYMSAKRGKGVQILHTIGDHLWFQGQRPSIPELGPPAELEEKETTQTQSEEAVEDAENSGLQSDEESEGSVPEENMPTDDIKAEGDANNDEEDSCEDDRFLTDADLENFSLINLDENKNDAIVQEDARRTEQTIEENPQKAMDELLRYSFLKALASSSAKKITLPVLTSNFFRLHVIPACPSNRSIDVKKSSYKKLSAFLATMAQEEIIKVREQVKGVESIVDINLNHTDIIMFEMWSDDIPEQKEEATGGKHETNASPLIVEMYKMTAAVLPLFHSLNYGRDIQLTGQVVRKHIIEYVKENKLQDPDNPRFVILDETLQKALSNKYGTGIEKLKIDELIEKCLSLMKLSSHVTVKGQTTVSCTKGKIEPVVIRVCTRSGNKKVTLINNLETFGIDCQDFAKKCQHGVAASTSISAVPGKKSAQILVQGNQVLFIGKLLRDEYRIPLRHIRGLENAPTKKKNTGKK